MLESWGKIEEIGENRMGARNHKERMVEEGGDPKS
jgi:hypothetical protein